MTSRPFDQGGTLWVIHIVDDRSIPDALHRFVDHEQGDHEPLPRNDRAPEAIPDLYVKPGGLENAMDQVLQLRLIDVEKFVGRNDVYIGHQIGRLQSRASDPLLHAHGGDANLVNKLPVSHDHRVI